MPRKYKPHPELTFRALLTEGDAEQLELEKA
jgi:hypothetical protein